MRFVSGLVSGTAITAGTVLFSFLRTQEERTRQSHLLREQVLILDSLHDQDVVLPEYAPVEWQRTFLRRQDPYDGYKRWWNERVESLSEWLIAGGLEKRVESGIQQLRRRSSIGEQKGIEKDE